MPPAQPGSDEPGPSREPWRTGYCAGAAAPPAVATPAPANSGIRGPAGVATGCSGRIAVTAGAGAVRVTAGLRSTELLRSIRYDPTPAAIAASAMVATIQGIHGRCFTLSGRVSVLALIFPTS